MADLDLSGFGGAGSSPRAAPGLRDLSGFEPLDTSGFSSPDDEDEGFLSSAADVAAETGKGIVRGAANVTGSMLKGLATEHARDPGEEIALDTLERDLPKVRDMSDEQFADFMVRANEATRQGRGRDLVATAQNIRTGRVEAATAPRYVVEPPKTDLQETSLYRAGEAVQKKAAEVAPVGPGFEESWTRSISEGLGSTVPFVAASVAGPVGVGASIAGGQFASSGEAIDRAVKAGATKEDIIQAARLGRLPGLTEQVPIEILLERIPLPYAGRFLDAVRRVMMNAAAEGGQEAVQQTAQNLIERYVYDPDQDIFDGVAEAAIVGSVVGGTLSGGVEAGKAVLPGQRQPIGQDVPEGAARAESIIGDVTPVETAPAASSDAPPGMVRLYHGGANEYQVVDTPMWFSSRREYADGYARKSDGSLWYVDVPEDYPDIVPDWPDQGIKQGFTFNLALPTELSAKMRRVSDDGPVGASTVAPPTLEEMLDDPRSAREILDDHEAAKAFEPTEQWQPAPESYPEDGLEVRRTEDGAKLVRRPPPAGTRENPVDLTAAPEAVSVGEELTQLPSPAQAEAGNYRKRHAKWHGLDISVETEQGQERSGIDEDGNTWSVSMPAPYGYIRRTEGADGDHVDVYLGTGGEQVLVVDQIDPRTLKFDEHKVMLGFPSEAAALDVYEAAFSDGSGQRRVGAVTPMTVAQFKQWVRNGGQKPLAYKPPRTRGTRAQRSGPLDLVEFLASKGGIRDDRGELAALGLPQTFVPGLGRLVRAGGMRLDYAREMAEQAGYLQSMDRNATTSVADLLTALDETANRGNRIYSVADMREQLEREANQAAKEDARRVKGLRTEITSTVKEHGGAIRDDEVEEALALIAERGYDVPDALTVLFERNDEALAAEQQDRADEPADIPFDAAAEDAASEGVAAGGEPRAQPRPGPRVAPVRDEPARGEPDAGREGAEGQERGVAPVEQPPGAVAPGTVEPGAEGLPQAVIPGTEPISDRELAELRARTPKRGSAPQQPPGGMFDRQGVQEEASGGTDDLFAAPAAEPQKASPEPAKDEEAAPRLDHGVLNVPLAKRGDIDAQIDRSKADQAKQEKAERKTRNASLREERAEAKRLLAEVSPEFITRLAEKAGITPAEVRKNLKSDAHWQPGRVIAALRDAARSGPGDKAADEGGERFSFRPEAYRFRQTSGGVEVEFVLTEDFVEQAQALTERLRSSLDKLGLQDVGVRVSESISAIIGGERIAAEGRYFEDVVDVALDAEKPAAVLDHEAIHAIRKLGLFTESEWQALARKSRNEWIGRHNIAETYAAFPEWAQIEEGVAHAYAAWSEGRPAGGVVARAFKRIRSFFEALGNSLRGLGFTSSDRVFERVSTGEVGGRPRDEFGRFASEEAMLKLKSEPQTAADRERAARGFIARGQPIDRAIRMPFDWFGGIDAEGRWKPGIYLEEKAAKAITSAKFNDDGRFAWLNGPLETARAGLIDRYGLDTEYVRRDRQRRLDERAILQEGKEFLETLSERITNADEAAVMQAILTGEKVDDAAMKRLATPIRNAIDELGQEAVLLGLVSQESFERNRGSYLHRVYLKHEVEQNGLTKFADRLMTGMRKHIIGKELKGRGIFLDLPASQLMKDVPGWKEGTSGAPSAGDKFLVLDEVASQGDTEAEGGKREKVLRRVYWPAEDAVPARYSGFREKGTWEVRNAAGKGLTLWRDYTREERRNMGEILDARYTIAKTYMLLANDLSTGRFFRDIAQNEEWSRSAPPPEGTWVEASEFRRLGANRSVLWVRVPDTSIPDTGGKKRYGALAGKYVRSEIWRDLNETEIASRPSTWRKLLTQWKLNKALALDTPIPTASGWTTMGEIKEGDQVFDEHGQICSVLEVKDVQHGRPCYEVAFSDGSTIVADEDHWWFTNHRNGGGGVRTTRELLDTLTINFRGEAAHSIPVADPMDLPEVNLPAPPYAFGLWLGDGSRSVPRITICEDVADEIEEHLRKDGVFCGARVKDRRSSALTLTIDVQPVVAGRAPNKFKQALQEVGALGNKQIPPSYLRASIDQRRALLQGLMDSDGWITTKGTCGFATSLPSLRAGVTELLRSLGYKPTVSESITRSGKPGWRIHFQAYADAPVCRLSDKVSRLRPRPASRQRSGNRQIVSITPVPSVPVRCIAVSSSSRLYLAGHAMIPTHNTARSPVVHMNNVMSNLLFMDMADVRAQDLVRAIGAYRKRNKDFQEAAENGAFGADMMSQEVRDNVLQPILDDLQKDIQGGVNNSFLAMAGLLGRVADRIWRAGKLADRKMIDLYRLEDELFRMATYLRRRELGATPEVAADFARQQFLDYDIKAPWVNAARNTVLPFISYTYRAAPVIAKSMAHRPWKMAKYATVAYALNALAYAWDDEADEERERASFRDEEQGFTWVGVPRMLRMPWRDEHGLPVFLDIRRWIPAGDIFDTSQGSSALPVPAPLQFGGPIMIAAELMLNKSAFFGEEIVNTTTSTTAERAGEVGDYLWKAWMPSAAWVPGSWYWEKIGRAASGATDGQGRPYSVPQAALSSVGIKVRPQDVDTELGWRFYDLKKVQDELKAQGRALGRQRERGLISEEAYERRMQQLVLKFERLGHKAQTLNSRAASGSRRENTGSRQ